jgi:hypothetical protein
MLRRFLIGALLGSVVGFALAAALVAGLKVIAFDGAHGTLEAYAAALVAGVLAGLVAGKPVWAADAKVEAGVKALFGALLATAGMFALRRWASGWTVDLRSLSAGGPGAVGDLPGASLPVIGAALGALFEVDNTGDGKVSGPSVPRARVASQKPSRGGRVATDDDEEGALSAPPSDLASKRAK